MSETLCRCVPLSSPLQCHIVMVYPPPPPSSLTLFLSLFRALPLILLPSVFLTLTCLATTLPQVFERFSSLRSQAAAGELPQYEAGEHMKVGVLLWPSFCPSN